jgi:hypothetical protein
LRCVTTRRRPPRERGRSTPTCSSPQHWLLATSSATFAAAGIREPLRAITNRAYEIPAFSPHLHELTEEDRGAVLEKTGAPRRYRFRFANPLLQPYVIMRAITEDALSLAVLDKFLRSENS